MGTPLGPKYIPYTHMDPLGWGSVGIIETKMETTILGFYRNTGRENGNHYVEVL